MKKKAPGNIIRQSPIEDAVTAGKEMKSICPAAASQTHGRPRQREDLSLHTSLSKCFLFLLPPLLLSSLLSFSFLRISLSLAAQFPPPSVPIPWPIHALPSFPLDPPKRGTFTCHLRGYVHLLDPHLWVHHHLLFIIISSLEVYLGGRGVGVF